MPIIAAWLREIEVTYPLMHIGDVNTVMFDVRLMSCGVGSKNVEETHDFINTLMCAMAENDGKIKISIEVDNEKREQPEIIRAEVSDLQ